MKYHQRRIKNNPIKSLSLLFTIIIAIFLALPVPPVVAQSPFLQIIIDDFLGPGVININADLTSAELFSAGDEDETNATLIAEFAGFALENEFGWYPEDDPTDLHVIFAGPDQPPAFTLVTDLPPSFGLYLKTPDGLWRSQVSLNVDDFDHFLTYDTPMEHGGGIIVAMEDLSGGGDQDFIDMVVRLVPLGEPTAITLASFEVEVNDGQAMVIWETATEIDNAGFNIYRASSSDGPWTQVNSALIAAEGDPVSGAQYTFADRPGRGTFYYRLADIDFFGLSTVHEPTLVEMGAAIRIPWFRPSLPPFLVY